MRNHAFPLALFAASLLGGAGCRPATSDHGHDHGEPKTAQITVWTDAYEVFAEHRAPVAGRPTTFVTHVTDRRTLAPRREGMVKFVFRQGDTVAEHPQAAPAQAGIYRPGITFPKPGEWRLTLLLPTDGTNATVELGSIKVYPDQPAADHAEMPDVPAGVTFLKEQQWMVRSQVEPVAERRLVERMRLSAHVRAKPGFSATVTAPVSGQLLAARGQALPPPGQRVEANQLLGWLRPNFSEAAAKAAEAQAEFAATKAALDHAEAAYRRTKQLSAAQAKSARELQDAELAYQSAQARHAAAAGLLATFRPVAEAGSPDGVLLMELRAPIAGMLNTVAAGPGELVAANQSLFTVLNAEWVWIEAHVPEAKVARLSAARGAELELPEKPGQFTPVTVEGRGQFLALGMEVNPATRTVPLNYEFHNAAGLLRIGQAVNLHVETARTEVALAIPNDAIVEEGGRPIVFVQLSGETFAKRDLTLGIRDGNWVQVLAGLAPGERVVTRGAFAVRLASVASTLPAHGHAH